MRKFRFSSGFQELKTLIKVMELQLLISFLITFPPCVLSQISLQESGGGAKKPGQTLQLTCTVSGFSLTSNAVNWIRQPPGKGLEWAGVIWRDGSNDYNSTLRSRISITRDLSRRQVSLQLRNLKPEDSAVYYCARVGLGSAFDVWGQGTMVTVTSASPSAPSLFPLLSYGSSSDNGAMTVGCLAKDFLPDSVTFFWDDKNNNSLADGTFKRFPSVFTGGTYTATSQASISETDWENKSPLFCRAKHLEVNKVVRVDRGTHCPVCPIPEMHIRAPPPKAFQTPYLNSTITCTATNLCTEKATIQWFKEGQLLDSGFTTNKLPLDNGKGYGIRSELVVTLREWNACKQYSCKVESGKYNNTLQISKCSFCPENPGEVSEVQVEAVPPSYSDIYMNQEVKLTCRISNIPYEQDLSELDVIWTRSNNLNREVLETVLGKPQDQENQKQFVDGSTTVCVADWNSGDTFSCKVAFPGLLPKPIEKSLRKPLGVPVHAPSVYILPPPSEQLALREMATLTCLVKGFSPSGIFLQWLHNDQPVSSGSYFTSTPMQEPKNKEQYFAYSMLNVNEQEWSSGDSYTCLVGHEGLPYNATQKTVDKNTVYLDEIVETTEDEELQSIMSILSTFIILFLMSLFYSATVTVIKVK